MGKKEDLREKLGDRINQSIGLGAKGDAPPPAPAAKDPRFDGVAVSKQSKVIRIAKIQPDPGQPRKEFDEGELEALATSLKEEGQLQPIRVRWDDVAKSYVIIMGERRYRAAQRAGLEALECVVENRILTKGALIVQQMVENGLRSSLTDIEVANAIVELMEVEGLKQREVAARLKIHEAGVSRYLSLLDLPGRVQELVHAGDLPATTAHELHKIEDDDARERVAERIVEEGLSRDAARREIAVEAERVAEERAEAGDAPADDAGAPAGDAGGVATAAPPARKAAGKKAAGKSKAKAADAKKPKLKTIRQFSITGHKVTVERAKGIDPQSVLNALEMAAEQVRMEIEDKAKREPAPAE